MSNYSQQSWPDDALEAVASHFLHTVEMETSERHGVIVMCKHFHQATQVEIVFPVYCICYELK